MLVFGSPSPIGDSLITDPGRAAAESSACCPPRQSGETPTGRPARSMGQGRYHRYCRVSSVFFVDLRVRTLGVMSESFFSPSAPLWASVGQPGGDELRHRCRR